MPQLEPEQPPAASRDPASHPRAHLPGSLCGGAEAPSRARLPDSSKGVQWGPGDQDSPALPRCGACSRGSSAGVGDRHLPSLLLFLTLSSSFLLSLFPASSGLRFLPHSTRLVASDPTDTPCRLLHSLRPGVGPGPLCNAKSFNTKQNQCRVLSHPLAKTNFKGTASAGKGSREKTTDRLSQTLK